MILTVSHVSTYRYPAPVRTAVQSLRMTPANSEAQKVLDWQVSVDGGQRGGCFRDGAGDWIEGWSVRGPLSEIVVRAEGRVDTRDTAGVLKGYREAIPPAAYLRTTAATAEDAALRALRADVVATPDDSLDFAHRLSAAIAGAIAYRPGATEAHTTAAEALALGEGVCQDHAHALIAVARGAGLPARYVSGYLFADAAGNAHEAAHAWAELWIGGLGWVGFDPANRCCADARYVRVGSGFDARDAAPIRGAAQGISSETLDVRVAVGAEQQ